MVKGRIILALPHCGTAIGHLIRMGEVLEKRYNAYDKVYVAIPRQIESLAKRHLPSFVELVLQNSSFSVTSPAGTLDGNAAKAVLKEDIDVFRRVRPELIIGSPGLRAGLLGTHTEKPWVGIMHGCYLPLPTAIFEDESVPETLRKLAFNAWKVAGDGMDYLVKTGSGNAYSTWAKLRETHHQILIPNTSVAEPSQIGIHIGNTKRSAGWNGGHPVSLLITLSSGNATDIPSDFLIQVARSYGEVVVAGPAINKKIPGVEFIGNNVSYETLVGPETTVICHGGHGTLKAVSGAGRVLVIPGDLDQLCNALIAHRTRGFELAISASWWERLSSDNPFQRKTDWSAIGLDSGTNIIISNGYKFEDNVSNYISSLNW